MKLCEPGERPHADTIAASKDDLWFANNPSRPKVLPLSAIVGGWDPEICWLGTRNNVTARISPVLNVHLT